MKKKILIIFLLIIIIASVIVLVLKLLEEKRQNELVPELNLIGEKEITLKLDEIYEEQGADALLDEEKINDKIKITGTVDNTKIGTYEIIYRVTNNRDKNPVEEKRIINVIDDISPKITLNGESKIKIYQNAKYTEQGAKATDNYDGDITESIVISGTVDTSQIGTYTIEYLVNDSSGNEAKAERKVTVQEKPQPKVQTTSGGVKTNGLSVLMYHFFYDKKVSSGPDDNWMEISDFEAQMKYLSENNYYFPSWQEVEDYIDGKISLPAKSVVITVDDGNSSFFELAVPIIKKYNVKATSFVITSWYGVEAAKYKSNNIILQSHSHNMHRSGSNGKGALLSASREQILADINSSNKLIGKSTVFCYPLGHYNENVQSVLKDAGIRLAFTTKYGRVYKGSNKMQLPRVRMSKGVSLAAFRNMVK